MIDLKQDFIPKGSKNRPGFAMSPRYITVHDTGNSRKGANAKNHANYLKNPSTSASWHFTIDDKEIIQHLPLNESAWHAGDGRYGRGNRTSIGIEICENADGNRAKAEQNAIKLIQHLMKKCNIPISKIVQHNYWTGKNCPRVIRARKDGWKNFINSIKREAPNVVVKPVKPYTTKVWRNYINGQIVKDLQTELNRQFNKGLAVDGWFGQDTINALVNVRKGARGNLTRIIQRRLITKGYKLRHGPDGIFGNGTYNAVVKFQRANKLSADGIVGKNTWKALFRK